MYQAKGAASVSIDLLELSPQHLLPALRFASCHHEWDPWQLVSGLPTCHVKREHHLLSEMRALQKDVQRHPGALTSFDWFAAIMSRPSLL
jgi:hypothetical protein